MGEAEFAHRAARGRRGRRARHGPPAGGRPRVRVDPEEREARSRVPRRAHVARRRASAGRARCRADSSTSCRARGSRATRRDASRRARSARRPGPGARAATPSRRRLRSLDAGAGARRGGPRGWRRRRKRGRRPRWKRPSGRAGIPSRRRSRARPPARGRDVERSSTSVGETGLSARISKADRSTLVALVADNLARFTERDACQALRHPYASEAMIEEILSSKTLFAFRSVRRLVAAHPQTPRHAALRCSRGPHLARSSRHRPRGYARRRPCASRRTGGFRMRSGFWRWARRWRVARFAPSALVPVALRRPRPARSRGGAREFAAHARGPAALARDRVSRPGGARVPRTRTARWTEPARGPRSPF